MYFHTERLTLLTGGKLVQVLYHRNFITMNVFLSKFSVTWNTNVFQILRDSYYSFAANKHNAAFQLAWLDFSSCWEFFGINEEKKRLFFCVVNLSIILFCFYSQFFVLLACKEQQRTSLQGCPGYCYCCLMRLDFSICRSVMSTQISYSGL